MANKFFIGSLTRVTGPSGGYAKEKAKLGLQNNNNKEQKRIIIRNRAQFKGMAYKYREPAQLTRFLDLAGSSARTASLPQ